MKSLLVATLLLATCALGAEYMYPNGQMATSSLRSGGKGWPACSPDTEQWSGLLDINTTTNKHYFYWAFGPRSKRVDAPVILWMTGGPGCSSSLALLIENGPCHISLDTGAMYQNPYAWNNDAYLIYIDQPAGVGFSYSDNAGQDANEAEVSFDMYYFIQDLMKQNPQMFQGGLTVVGESYGGHFAPATAHKIFEMNKIAASVQLPVIPLKGLAVGNGLTAPYVQYKYYEELAYSWCIEKLGQPCVDQYTAQQMNQTIPSCISAIESCMQDDSACGYAQFVCNQGLLAPYEETGRNVYDIRKPCNGPLCYDMTYPTNFMNRADVQQSLGVTTQTWQACNDNVNGAFGDDWFQTFDGYVADLVNGGTRVMIYAGDVDFICNWLGNRAWTLNLEWNQKAAFNAAPELEYSVNGTAAAKVRSVSGATSPILFSFVQVFNAGHMVPMDQPAAIFSLISKFLNNQKWF